MKKILFGIFAHPDDEGFGPSGTLIKEAQSGTDLHLLCITRGDAGRDVNDCGDLSAVRRAEWEHAGELMGACAMKYFGYDDGSLCNAMYHEIASKIQAYVKDIVSSSDEPIEVCFMTFGVTGLSGHLDHIAVSHIATFSFLRLQQTHPSWQFGRLRYFCLPYDKKLANDISYVYMPPGRPSKEIHETVDVTDVFEQKLTVMRAHQSQRDDMDWILEARGDAMKSEEFRHLQNKTI